MSNLISRRAVAGLATAGTLLLGVLATAPQAGAQPVYVCQKVGGTFHVVSSKQHCKKGEGKLSLGVSEAGAMGVVGATGPAGVTGSAGPAGPAGPMGPEGPAGKSGAAAAQGEAGPKGVTGAIGPTGPTGPAGTPGTTGTAGATGAAGATGSIGAIVKVKETNKTEVALDGSVIVQAKCPTGDILVGGGFKPKPTGVVVLASGPDAEETGWEYTGRDEGTGEESNGPVKAGEVTVWAFCGPK